VVRTRRLLCTWFFYCSRHSHARTQLNFTLDDFCISSKRTHGQLVTKPGFFWHHHLKTTSVRETISFWKMLSSASLTTWTGNWGYTATYCYLLPLLPQPTTTNVDFTFVCDKCYDCTHWCFYKRCFYQFGTLLVLAVQETKKKKRGFFVGIYKKPPQWPQNINTRKCE